MTPLPLTEATGAWAVTASWLATREGDRSVSLVGRTLRRSEARRSLDSSLAKARSSAAYRSSAAASARIAGPRDRMVSSTRSRRSDCLGLRSLETSTSIRTAF